MVVLLILKSTLLEKSCIRTFGWIDLQERKIVSTDVTGIQERLSAEEVEETLGKEAQNFRRLLLCGSGSVFTGIYIPEIF